MIFTTFFVNMFVRTRYEKKVNSRYNTEKNLLNCVFVFSLYVFFVCVDARNNMCESNYPLK